MPPVRKVDLLPPDIRRELDERAAAAGWGDARGLSAWLSEQGYEIGKTAVGEHVQALRAEYDGTMREVRAMAELSRILVEQDPDSQAALNDMAGRIMTDQLVRAAKDLRGAVDMSLEDRIGLLKQLAQPITQAQRAAVYQRRHTAEVRAQIEAEARAGAADRAAVTAQAKGVSADGIAALRAAIMGEL